MKLALRFPLLISIVRIAILLSVIATQPLVAQNGGDADATARSQVLALEKLWNQAYKAGDAKALASILDNALVLVEDDGSLKSKADFLSSIKGRLRMKSRLLPNR